MNIIMIVVIYLIIGFLAALWENRGRVIEILLMVAMLMLWPVFLILYAVREAVAGKKNEKP